MQRCHGGPGGAELNVTRLASADEPVSLEKLLEELSDPSARLEPFAAETLSFCSELSRAIFHDAETRRFPELQALAYWMRASELQRLRAQYEAMLTPEVLRVPRGLV